MSPAPPKGILVLAVLLAKAAAPALAHPSRWHGVVPLTLEEFTFGSSNTFSPGGRAGAYEQYAVPEPARSSTRPASRTSTSTRRPRYDFKNDDRAPLLIVGATKDNTVPASLARKQYEKYERFGGQTDYVEFQGRPHLIMAAEGWEEVAAEIESGSSACSTAPGAACELTK